ncbi:MAG: hypothetical protein AAFN93_01820 [Bacteroidota bacterium]
MAEKISEEDLYRLQKTIEDKLGWGRASSWHSSMFEELSEKVFDETQLMLSVPTLKRFFGVVNHKGAPSITTLDTLSRFIGKENWRVFKLSRKAKKSWSFKKPHKSLYVIAGFVIALVTISLISNRRPALVIDSSEFSFSSKVLSFEYPNSVVFDFAIPDKLEVDSLKIQQYWDPRRTINISKDQTTATGIYYYPGYFQARLLVDGQIAKEHDLFLKSNGWLGLVEYSPVPKYFKPEHVGQSGLKFPADISKEVQSLDEPITSTFHFIDDLGDVSGDDFTFSTTIQTSFDDRWAVCQRLRIFFLGSDGALIIPFSKIGCSSENSIMLNDVFLNGKENDLSALSADFSEPVDISIVVKDKLLEVAINNTNVYTLSYNDTMGKLVGFRYKFEGLGEVLNYQLHDQNNSPIELKIF